MRVLGIAGSPRRGGNTETLLDGFLDGARSAGADVEKIAIAPLQIHGCTACNGCWGDGECVIEDDLQAVEAQLIAADVIALAAPLFFWGLPAQVKALVDRGQALWARKFILKAPLPPGASGHPRRRGVFLSAGGEAQPDFAGAIKTVRGFFGVHAADYWAELLYGDMDDRDAARRHPTALQEAFALGVEAGRAPI